jgi:hypothetical protein
MKYGELLVRKKWFVIKNYKRELFAFRFRIDPVPFIHKTGTRYFGTYYRVPKIMNEKRQWDNEYGRRKRSPRCLPDAWDDYQRSDIRTRKSWKKCRKVKKQWMKNIG